jgi:outer membrane lipoprotein LolB
MLRYAAKLLIVTLLVFLSGCALFQQGKTEPGNRAMSWKARSAELNRIQAWTAHGSVSIQHDAKTDIASVQWRQQQQDYQFALSGPLGFGRVEITGGPASITLQQSNKPPVSAATPELLMQNQLGWHIPISHLYYWARGLPAPGMPSKKIFDAYHHLTQLQQEGWQIDYLEYMPVNGVDLPRTMQLSTDRLKIKLVIREWELADDAKGSVH